MSREYSKVHRRSRRSVKQPLRRYYEAHAGFTSLWTLNVGNIQYNKKTSQKKKANQSVAGYIQGLP